MIKSQNKTFGFRLMLIMTLFMLALLLSAFSQTFAGFTIIKMSMPTFKAQLFQFAFPMIGVLLFGSQAWRDANFITIDTSAKKIIFSNIFIRRKRRYDFNYFDGFIDTFQRSRSGTYRVIYLVRDKKFIEKISSFYYSNLDEMQDALTPIKNLGQQRYDILKSIKVLFNRQILD
ncbi:MAG: hypothetical protein ACTHJ5_08490 [Ilyomonas sp.]